MGKKTVFIKKQMMYGQPSWWIQSSDVDAFVTEQGGHLAPVVFYSKGRKIQPFAIAPWWKEKIPSVPPLLLVLRGDFFCMPFGGNQSPYQGEKHPPHGETANRKWKFKGLYHQGERNTLHLNMKTHARPAVVEKKITLVNGHNAVYSQHIISGITGNITLGHHPILYFSSSGIISTSPIRYGMVSPEPMERPENGGYSILQPGMKFRTLNKVKLITGEYTDLSRYPARRGFEDLVILITKPQKNFSWAAVTFPKEKYVWFALKDPTVLKQTILWLSNGGRYYAPWNGRHINALGIEDVTSYFHYGLAESVQANCIFKNSSETFIKCNIEKPLIINYIMAVAQIPDGFDRVKCIKPIKGRDSVILLAESGYEITVPLEYNFLKESIPT